MKNVNKMIRIAAMWSGVAVCTFAQVSYDEAESVYRQDFTELSTKTGEHPWQDNETLQGWYLFSVNQGQSPDTYLEQWSAGINRAAHYLGKTSESMDLRVWGARTAAQYGNAMMGVALVNHTGRTLRTFDLRFAAYQFHDTIVPQQMRVAYSTDAHSLNSGNWTPLPTLTYTGPFADGNNQVEPAQALESRQMKSLTNQAGNWGPGELLWIRWTSYRDLPGEYTAGAGALAITDVIFRAR